MSELKWLKSSFSEASGNACVEVAAMFGARLAIRESESPADVLTTDRAALEALIRSLRRRTPSSDR
ncbi:DUF397 domain-containing protein [Streptomyces sp. G5(2025)]|uniref:DUF397 domain-containing protein n=1 Tax=Streptomyces sp. G5(2025) TaxID=3406628 RepID=UPI003C1E93A5